MTTENKQWYIEIVRPATTLGYIMNYTVSFTVYVNQADITDIILLIYST